MASRWALASAMASLVMLTRVLRPAAVEVVLRLDFADPLPDLPIMKEMGGQALCNGGGGEVERVKTWAVEKFEVRLA